MSRAEQSRAEQSRAEWIDVCRGIGIWLVILGHCNPPFNKYIYSFHMPLFFILSGYLFKKRNLSIHANKMVIRYIVPYFVLCIINLIMQMIKDGGHGFLKYAIGILYSRGTTEWMPNCSPLWFMTCITCALFIYNLILSVKNVKIHFVLIVLCALISYNLYLLGVPKLPWNIDTALMSLVFLYCGTILKKYDKCFLKISPLLIVVFGMAGIISAYLNSETVNFDNNCYGNLFLMIMSAVSISLCIIYFVRKMDSLPKIFSFYGRHTVFIMGFDYFSGMVAMQFANNFAFVFILKIIILTIGILLWTRVVSQISNDKLRQVLSI